MINPSKWVEDLKKFWIDKEINKIMELFDENVEYWENPFEIITDLEEIWQEIKQQEILNLQYKILGTKNNRVITNFVLGVPKDTIDMVYEIELNEQNKSTYFKQWYMQKNKE